uniref:Putative peritrophin-1 n=1 Tax=Lutzomyia longipalpis TaxID=7200 RepID=A0A1B0CP06_LUTLO
MWKSGAARLLHATVLILTAFHTTSGQKPEEEYKCPIDVGNGNYADPKTCKRFYQCVDGYPYLNRCPSGLFFDDISKYCTFKDEARCGPIATSQKPEEEYKCPIDVGNGNYADPKTCKRFYQCVDGYPYLNRCPSGLFFDDISKYCTFKDEARCGPIATTPAPVTDTPQDLATKCDLSECQLPYCFCSKDGTLIPGGLDPDNTPQIILLTFDGAVNLNNFDHYKKVFNGKRKNPNGCPIRGTFFISHEYSNYQQIQTLASEGHEMATETISLQQGLQDKGYEEWMGEMIGMREILRHFSNVSTNSVVGMRAPFLKPGRNTQYKVIEDFGYVYDSSVTVPPQSHPVWPYTLDYKIPHECKSGTCPTKSFPGVWELPLNAHYVESFEGGHCPYLDQCVLHNHDPTDVLEWLQEDFARHYEQNKAPYMMAFHTNWFQIKELEQGLHKFLDWANSHSVTVPPQSHPVWPYTLDYKIPHECKSGTCPTKSFPGVWELPLNAHYVESFEGGHCPYLDQCVLHNHDPTDVLEWLQEDFARHYEQNKAPYMMAFHTNWFQIKELEQGLHKFLDWANSQPDVWFVTATQALQWVADPKPLKTLNKYDPWDCKNTVPAAPKPCNISNKCALAFKRATTNITDTRYMETCTECPNQYPWLGDAEGTGVPGRDNYIYSSDREPQTK